MRTSIRRDPRVLANAIFPIIGPAIRQSVSEALRRLVEALNRTLELGMSWRGLRWRWEAWRTGRPLGEVVLAHSLIYRVEQVFLIHRPTGLLLVDVAGPGTVAENQDVISAMLTAVKDFVKDSFRTTPGDEDSERFAWETWNCGSRAARMPCWSRRFAGQAPVEYRERLRRVLEAVHKEEADTMAAFSGDNASFGVLQPALEECLEIRYRESAPGGGWSWKLMAATGLVAVLLIGWAGNAWWRHRREAAFLDRLRAEPGILVTESRRQGGKLRVTGLKDPMASDPASMAWSLRLVPDDDVVMRWEPYLALTPELTLRRARSRLNPPSGVNLEFHEGTLVVAGVSSPEWTREAGRLGAMVPGVERVDVTGLTHDGAAQVQKLVESLKRETLYFDTAQTVLSGQTSTVNSVVETARALENLVEHFGKGGVAGGGARGSIGTRRFERALEPEERAAVKARLVGAGVSPEFIQVVGVGSTSPLRPQAPTTDAANRRVTFEVGSVVKARQSKARSGKRDSMIQLKLCLLGSFAVGKTSLVARFSRGILEVLGDAWSEDRPQAVGD